MATSVSLACKVRLLFPNHLQVDSIVNYNIGTLKNEIGVSDKVLILELERFVLNTLNFKMNLVTLTELT